jgi:branched-chain amino acid transport system ATP-binding protein
MTLLELGEVTKSFGGIKAVTRVSLTVPRGSIFGLIGPNGAGKTTVFNLITGVYRPDGGTIRLDNVDLVHRKPAEIAAVGVARTFQNIRLFGQMSVLDNVLVACETARRTGLHGALSRSSAFRDEERALRDKALSLLDLFDLSSLAAPMAIRGASRSPAP